MGHCIGFRTAIRTAFFNFLDAYEAVASQLKVLPAFCLPLLQLFRHSGSLHLEMLPLQLFLHHLALTLFFLGGGGGGV